MEETVPCSRCGELISVLSVECFTCSEPNYPNVAIAGLVAETEALEERYQAAKSALSAIKDDAVDRINRFEAILDNCYAVQCMRVTKLLDAVQTEDPVPTYHGKIGAGLSAPKGDKWDHMRRRSESELFGAHLGRVNFLAMCPDKRGVIKYGGAAVSYRKSVIEHRTTAYHENNVIWHEVLGHPLQAGYRALWGDRSKLGVAKHAEDLATCEEEQDLCNILVEQGSSDDDERFIELHCWGSLNVRSMEEITLDESSDEPALAALFSMVEELIEDKGLDIKVHRI